MSAAAVGIGSVVAVGPAGAVDQWPAIVLGAATAFLFTGGGNALNDFYDRDVDRVNHPARPIPSGRIEPKAAFDFALALFLLAVGASAFVNLAAFGLVLVSLALMIGYEVRFKSNGWSGNLLIGWLVGSLFLFAGLCVYRGEMRPLQIAASLAVLAGLTLGLDQRLMMPVADYERLKSDLPAVEWVDAGPLLWRMRMLKSPAEVACIREADRIVTF